MRTIESGKYKGKILADCPKEYIEWASKHRKNFSPCNRWVSDDSKAILERCETAKAQAEAVLKFEAERDARMAVKAAQQIVRANQDAAMGSLNVSRGFCLMR